MGAEQRRPMHLVAEAIAMGRDLGRGLDADLELLQVLAGVVPGRDAALEVVLAHVAAEAGTFDALDPVPHRLSPSAGRGLGQAALRLLSVTSVGLARLSISSGAIPLGLPT